MRINIVKLAVSLVACQLAGLIGSVFTASSVNSWYSALDKPGFNPPDWVFAPVWTALFILMGIALYIVWNAGTEKKEARAAITIFLLQLFLNILWSVLFFGLMAPLYAFIEILVLWAAILVMILKFYRVSRISAYLLMPYILWVSFAAVLNFAIWIVNL